ncbi:hypothetical protein FQA39_LY09628 [Lamprigera yunnana]|nr:hypothetical protein FQA39_LY09628 [Lamprigera yunnana]
MLMIGVVFSLPIPILFNPDTLEALRKAVTAIGLSITVALGVTYASQAMDAESVRPWNINVPHLSEPHFLQTKKGKVHEKLEDMKDRAKDKFDEWVRDPKLPQAPIFPPNFKTITTSSTERPWGSTYQKRLMKQLVMVLQEYKVDVLAVQESKQKGNESFDMAGYTFSKRRLGTGFIISERLKSAPCYEHGGPADIMKKIKDTLNEESVCFITACSVSVGVWTLVAISVERYYAICHPLRSLSWQTVNHAYKTIAMIWCGSFVCMSPIAMLSQLQPTNQGIGLSKHTRRTKLTKIALWISSNIKLLYKSSY